MASLETLEILEVENPNIWKKITKYCVYQERCSYEVLNKLTTLGVGNKETSSYLALLKKQGFVEDERFAKAYCRGKFRQKQWGRLKIKAGLRSKGIADSLILAAFSEISEEEYLQVLQTVIQNKGATVALSKGFEKRLIGSRISDF
ncbi:MAG: RecX family transcriptional regulator [Bacteroidales bacterium]